MDGIAHIYFKKNGGLAIPYLLNKEWLIRIPTIPHRLSRAGTCSLKMAEKYHLVNLKGIVYIDMTKRAYVMVPLTILTQYELEGKSFQGLKNSIFVYQIKQMLVDHPELELIPILTEEETKKVSTGVAASVKERFGI